LIQTIKDRKEKFGRYLAEIWLEADDGSRVNINDLLVQQGHAIYQEY
jgi:micrococcal nuclease